MPYLRDYHVFISHSWDYNIHFETIKSWLDSTPYFTWSDYSVPVTKPITTNVNERIILRQRIRDRITVCSCVIILSGMYVNYSYWIDYEIDVAINLGKPIIGVKPWGQERIPTKVQDYATVIVGWNSSSVIDAIRDYSL